MHEHLIAPRPVRIASNPLLPYRRSAPPHIRPIKLVPPLSPPDPLPKQSLEAVDVIPEEPSPRSPPATPRSPVPLPAETLEEFLSILRPSVMPFHSLRVYSTSPMRPNLRSHTPRASITSINSDNVSPASSPDVPQQENSLSLTGNELETIIPYWRSGGILSSPVSRTHTRNPFCRRPSHENLALALVHNHSFTQQRGASNDSQLEFSPRSPTQIPLPPSTSPPPFSILQESKDAIFK